MKKKFKKKKKENIYNVFIYFNLYTLIREIYK